MILLQADLKEPIEINRMFDTIVSSGTSLDITVNSAASFLKKNIEKLNKVNPEFKAYFLSRSDPIFDRMAGQLD